MREAEHIGGGCTVIFSSELGRNYGFNPVITLKPLAGGVQKIVMKHMLFNDEQGAVEFARHAFHARRAN